MNQIRPAGLTAILVISSWMTYRVLGLIFLGETDAFGGSLMASAWVIPLGQDALVGLCAPFVVYLLATRPKVITYAIGLAWLWWGVTDFVVGIVTGANYPPTTSLFGPHTPGAMMEIWLYGNLFVEIWALYLMLTPSVRAYFQRGENQAAMSVSQSPMGGAWIYIIIVSGLVGLTFPYVAIVIDGVFQLLGFAAA